MRRFLMTVAFFFAASMAIVCQNSEDLLAVESQAGSGYAFINKHGKIVLPGPYQGGSSFSEGLAAVNINSEWAYIDESGKVVISDLHVRTAGRFVEGRAYVEDFEGRYGFIDRTGRAVVPLIYEVANNRDIYEFAEGRVPVMADGKWGYLDTQGDFVISGGEPET